MWCLGNTRTIIIIKHLQILVSVPNVHVLVLNKIELVFVIYYDSSLFL